MNDSKILPDDPKLTAYALGELEGDDCRQFEARLRSDPAAQSVVDDIRAAAAQFEAALKSESDEVASALSAFDRGPTKPVGKPSRGAADEYPAKKSGRLRFPRFYFVLGGLAAACFALVTALQNTAPEPVVVHKPVEAVVRVATPVPTPEATEAKSEIAALPPPTVQAQPEETPKATAIDRTALTALSIAPTPLPARLDQIDLSLLATVKHEVTMKGLSFEHLPNRADTSSTPEMVRRSNSGTAPQTPAGSLAVVGTPKASNGHWGNDSRSVLAPVRRVLAKTDALGYEPKKKSASGPRAQNNPRDRGLIAAAPQMVFGADAGSSREGYVHREENGFLSAADNPLSTFSADVDTASYSNVRRMLNSGVRPPADAVRIEELINYFPYRYAPPPANSDAPFAAAMEVTDAPWAPTHRLVRIALMSREVAMSERGAANLVFLIDVSGSMNAPNKLPLVKESLRLLLGRLRKDDRVAIVTYAGHSGLALPSIPVAKAQQIIAALDELSPHGSTNGAMGIHLAYDIAKANFVKGGINRVVLCTDGDFNVGETSDGALKQLITEKAKSGVFLTVLGFGMGNLQDGKLQQLADAGNGQHGYIDSRREAEKLLVEQISGTLVTIAKDVKLQVEFNPARVASYRLIGYEKRVLKKEDFNNDKVDAGEMGAGHAVTALYEVVPAGVELAESEKAPKVDALKYSTEAARDGDVASRARTPAAQELLTLKIRYKDPTGEVSRKLELPLTDTGARFTSASDDFKFATAVAAFGMLLQDSPLRGAMTWRDVANWAESAAVDDPNGYRAEFVSVVKKAESLAGDPRSSAPSAEKDR